MSPHEVNRAVARATGESIATIERLGFHLAETDLPRTDADDEEFGPYVIDWDSLDATRHVAQSSDCCDARSAPAEMEASGAYG